jgi:hypothetical protein
LPRIRAVWHERVRLSQREQVPAFPGETHSGFRKESVEESVV